VADAHRFAEEYAALRCKSGAGNAFISVSLTSGPPQNGIVSFEKALRGPTQKRRNYMPLPGVYTARKKDGTLYFRSSVTYHAKHISLGSFPSEQAAHQAYQEASRIINDTSVTFQSYLEDSPLPFEKWVCLLNFRDNGIYIANPIYIRLRYFEYYLSLDDVLKFDLDDLFYYSSRKIMRRGNRLFVADYGMQVGISSRYGIKSHAVEGRDYRFVNGDPTDFRYENIEIKNSFHGVSQAIRHGKPCYRAKIHINGDFVIGYYETDIQAAIAYNKAVDVLRSIGITKRYVPNYIENLSPSLYADLYNQLSISPKITTYRPAKKPGHLTDGV